MQDLRDLNSHTTLIQSPVQWNNRM